MFEYEHYIVLVSARFILIIKITFTVGDNGVDFVKDISA